MIFSIALIILAIFGAPLFTVIAASAMLGYQKEGIDLMAIAIEVLGIAGMPMLSAIPLFTFAGYLLSHSNAPHRLVRMTNALLGWMPGGLALVALAACAFFTAFTGASGVTIIALGAILYPALKQDGYPDNFNLGLVTTSGSLGLLFAPSLPLILYGVVAEISIDDLFKAGVLPGMLMLVLLSGYSLWINRHNRKPLASFSWKEVAGALLGGEMGVTAADRSAGRNLLRLFRGLRSGGGHGLVCADCGSSHPARNQVARPSRRNARIDAAGWRHPDYPRCVAGVDQLHD